jgi:hypothetical protein
MNILATVFILVDAALLLALPRRLAAFPLIAVACYLPISAGFDIGPFNFYGARVILTIAFIRIFVRGERLPGGTNGLDWLMFWWAITGLLTTLLHNDVWAVFINRLGVVFTGCGIYFTFRVFCTDRSDITRLCRMTALLLAPVALLMLYEKLTGNNPFAEFGGVSSISEVRNGTVRAQGAFGHSILAGTAGAVLLPLMGVLWRSHRTTAICGIAACLTMVFSSGSTGPIMSTAFGIGGLLMWRMRDHMKFIRRSSVLGYIGLEMIMNAPAYYILAYIDFTGSSTSWHRAALIEAAVTHFSEWWLAGTDYTRHWMAYGVLWTSNHVDITNYYIRMGVDGGMPLLVTFIAVLGKGFSLVGTMTQLQNNQHSDFRFTAWALGAALFAHAATFMSVSYFDQCVVFLYMNLALIGSAASAKHSFLPESTPQVGRTDRPVFALSPGSRG